MRRVYLDHWWTSPSERLALNFVRRALEEEGIELVDTAEGADAHACLMTARRVWDGICGSGPHPIDLAPFLTPFDLDSRIFAPFKAVNSPSQLSLFGVPLGAFRNNVVWVNRKIADRINFQPHSEVEWIEWLERASEFVPHPIELGREDWQLSLLFEQIVLSMHGADFHRRVFGMGLASALASARIRESLEYLKLLARYVGPYDDEKAWYTAAASCRAGRCAAIVMGDWAHIEFCDDYLSAGSNEYESVYKWTAPGTDTSFLYNVDYIVPVERERAFTSDEVLATLTRTLLRPEVQGGFGLVKGALPAVRDATAATIDSTSWKTFHLATLCPDILLPSMSHLQGPPRRTRDCVSNAVRYVLYAGGEVSRAHAFLRMWASRNSAQAGRAVPLTALDEHDSGSYLRALMPGDPSRASVIAATDFRVTAV